MAQTIRYFEGTEIRATQPDGMAHPRVEIVGDRVILQARIKRAFPLSKLTSYLSIQDGAGKEVGVLRELAGLDEASQAIFQEQLDRRYFTPQIERISLLKQEAGMWRFSVITQRGVAEFYVRNWRDSAVEIAPNRWQIMSVDGGRFEIPNLEAMDDESRRFMDQLL